MEKDPSLPLFIWNMIYKPLRVNDEYSKHYDNLYTYLNDPDIEVSKRNSRRSSQQTLTNVASLILKGLNCATLMDTDEVYFYNEKGYWERGAEKHIRAITTSLSMNFTAYNINEIIDKIRRITYVSRDRFNPINLVGFFNGVYHLKEKKFNPHSPNNWLTRCLPVEYNPEAKCPNFEKWGLEVTTKRNFQTLLEAIGYCLWPDYELHRAFVLLGPTHSGKSTFLRLLTKFLGSENVSSLTLQQITNKQFLIKLLFGKLANLSPDMPSKAIYSTGVFKAAVGEDKITADVKGKEAFEFTNTAKLFFSANDLPPSEHDDSDAFYTKWIILDFSNQFLDNADPRIEDRISTAEELSGVLNLALKALDVLFLRGRFEDHIDPRKKEDDYLLGSNLEKFFVKKRCVLGEKLWIVKDELYEDYKILAKKLDKPAKAKNVFTTQLYRWCTGVKASRRRINGQITPIYWGITLRGEIEEEIESQSVLSVRDVRSSLDSRGAMEMLTNVNDTKQSLTSYISNSPVDTSVPDTSGTPSTVSKNQELDAMVDPLIELIDLLCEEDEEGLAKIKEVLDLAVQRGMNKDQVNKAITEFLKRGIFFEPQPGAIRRP